MHYRQLGRTGLKVSALGFGCGAVGGLLVKGDYRDMVRVIERAIECGISYFDTARVYGDGKSETNLGRVLAELNADVVVGTKVRLTAEEMDDIESAVINSVEGSLKRLKFDRIDLIQLHNSVSTKRQPERQWVSPEDVQMVISAFQKLKQQGKVSYWGINGLGETDALHQVVATGNADTVQSCYNLINPSAGNQVKPQFRFQDYQLLIDKAVEKQMGVIAIRVLAAGALSGTATRHPNAAQNVAPIATGSTFAEDVALAQRFNFLVEEGHTSSLVEAAIRFAVGNPAISTALVGISNMDQLEQAVAAAEKGSLPASVLSRIHAV